MKMIVSTSEFAYLVQHMKWIFIIIGDVSFDWKTLL